MPDDFIVTELKHSNHTYVNVIRQVVFIIGKKNSTSHPYIVTIIHYSQAAPSSDFFTSSITSCKYDHTRLSNIGVQCTNSLKLTVYHPGVFIKFNNMVLPVKHNFWFCT